MSARKRYVGIFLRGVAMGAADVVPGVSGGTVAFITGIYDELLDTIKSINVHTVKVLLNRGPLAFWQQINGNFLLALMLGILLSILSLARVISFLLHDYPLLVWSFFFGLIVASSLHMVRQIKHWHVSTIVTLVAGVLFAYTIVQTKPMQLDVGLITVFLTGAVAICAMILPGVSGSFILLLLGMYGNILAAVRELQWLVLASFAAGCAVGLLSFSHVLSWLLRRYHDASLAALTGFLIGSLYLVWPWKITQSYYQNSKGLSVALEQQNVLPNNYQLLTGADANTLICVILMLAGFLLVFGFEKMASQSDEKVSSI